MLTHYFRIAARNLWKHKGFTAINIIGLTVGLTCCLLMGLYIQHELSYDRFQKKGDRIARVIMEYSVGGTVNKGNFTSTKVAPAFKKNFPEVETSVRMYNPERVVKVNDKLFNEKRFMYADSGFFNLFSFPVVKGNTATMLSGPNKIVLTRSAARKYFGDEDPVGKTMLVGSSATPYEVTGLMEDCPSNSQIKFDLLASFSSLGVNQERTYWEANYTTYLLLQDASSIRSLQAKIPAFLRKDEPGVFTGNDYIGFHLEPFQKIHLYSEHDGFEPNNSITYIYIVACVALLMLAIACFTYINLSTARSMERAREVGIRKVAGAFRQQIFWQFIGESLLVSGIAWCISMAASGLALPAFNQLAQRELQAEQLLSPFMLALSLGTIVLISLAAGSYPALVLSRFQPVKVLKGSFRNSGSGLWLRKSLIVFQFMISVFLIISTFIIQKQLSYIQHKKLGYDRDHVVMLPLDPRVLEKMELLKAEFKRHPDVKNVTRTQQPPSHIRGGYFMRLASRPQNEQHFVNGNPVDEEFVPALNLTTLAGSNLTRQDVKDVTENQYPNRHYHFIINESAARQLGFRNPQEAVGQKMFLGEQRPGTIKAVVKDFHIASLHNPINPLVLFPETYSSLMMVKLSGRNMPQTLRFLESKWKLVAPHRPFEYRFLDEDYNKLYQAEMNLGKVLNIFSGIAMLLACMGLFGLTVFATQQRIKEIGIRKVLGATVGHITFLVSREFLTLVLIAFLAGAPVAWLAMSQWLQDFTFRIDMPWWIVVLSGVAVVLIAFTTVSIQAIRAAISNPVKSLRAE